MSAVCSGSGLDTVRFRWRTSNDHYRHFQRRAEGTIEGYRGERFTQTKLGRIGVFPDGLVYMEGRASALSSFDSSDHSLLPVVDFHSAEQVARRLVRENGVPLEQEVARLGRVDLAAELRFSSPLEGSAFLHSLACLDVPWCKSRVDGRKGDHIETVSFHGTQGHTIYLRAYDKGVESGTAAPGVRIRVERQRRFRKEREPSLVEFSSLNHRKLYLGREFSRLVDLPCATVCDVPEALSVLSDCVSFDEVSASRAVALAGFIVLGAFLDFPKTTRWRFTSDLRRLGIFVDPSQLDRVEVPVGLYLQSLSSAWAA